MRVALANAKGGVAKTTSCIYLAAVLARRGIEVAVYDADPQSSASLWAAAAEQARDPLPFDVLPANMATLAHLGGDPAAREWSIIDAPPQGPLLDKTLAVADFVIVPTSFCPLLDPQIKAFTKIAAVSSDFYISYINAQSFLNNYEETVTRKYNLVDDSNPVLMNIYVK